ncbi:MAG TPA: Glu/Leu/Phe/Val dehydrogenase [Patescibacteria group bacterium]|nr:Glu/Leu/Phe/Val dehydrogenase [Patescibacteria group bacterium]
MTKLSADNVKRIDHLKDLLNLSAKEVKLLKSANQIKKATINLKGKKYQAFRVVYNRALGPGKGGIRFHQGVNEEEVTSLSFWMTIKNALAGIPYGGGKGGIRINPKNLSEKEKETLSREYIRKFYKFLGQDKDIPAPDVYTNSQVMSWMLDEFEKKTQKHEPGMITGKPVELGGLLMRQDATAKGAYIVVKEVIKKNFKTQKPSFVIQGFGNAGSYLAQMLSKDGYKILAVSDSKGGIYNKKGLKVEELVNLKSEGKSVVDYKDGEKISGKELLELDTDILALAALGDQITKKNADNVKAKYILELANGPVSEEADKILFNKNTMIIPDILANSGGVIASYFEWAQNRAGNILDNDYLQKLLESKMKTNWQKVYQQYLDKDKTINLRTSAYIIAVKKILIAEKLRGNL